MQVMPSTARWLASDLGLEYGGHSSLYDPKYNIRLGAHYLHMMHQKFGNIEKAIAAYNRGPTGLIRYLRQGRKFPSRYLVRVMGYYRELKNGLDSDSDRYAAS
jgi:soluble lytic murein transglycosylase